MKKTLLIYLTVVTFFAALIWFVIDMGSRLIPKSGQILTLIQPNESISVQFVHQLKSPLALLLLQVIIILLVSKLFGLAFIKLKQPAVIGEMLAGIFLGPSIVGMMFPELSDFIFPKSSLGNLQLLSQIGLIFFMFIIGMDLDIDKLKNKAHSAVVISHASIIFPYALGVLLSYFIYEQFAPAHVSFLAFALFMGIAISITAFPVLARILHERKETKTTLGIIAITCAAFDDVTAWCILTAVIAIVKSGSVLSAVFPLLLSITFVLIFFYVVRPWIKRIDNKHSDSTNLNKPLVVIVFFILFLSAYISEIIGIHALFGAFLAGVIMPQKLRFKEQLTEKIEDISVLVLLPLFFVFTGLRTQIGLLNEGYLWGYCALIIFVAVLGKFGGSAFSAKLVGHSWKDSLSIGALMNTRGLMELIVLNIGYDLGILSPEIFAIMVLMALITTFMTNPLLDLINFIYKPRAAK